MPKWVELNELVSCASQEKHEETTDVFASRGGHNAVLHNVWLPHENRLRSDLKSIPSEPPRKVANDSRLIWIGQKNGGTSRNTDQPPPSTLAAVATLMAITAMDGSINTHCR